MRSAVWLRTSAWLWKLGEGRDYNDDIGEVHLTNFKIIIKNILSCAFSKSVKRLLSGKAILRTPTH